MKAFKMILSAQMIPLIAILLGGCAKPNKELIYGTWINEKMVPQKVELPRFGRQFRACVLGNTLRPLAP
jgi:hypothetical protein